MINSNQKFEQGSFVYINPNSKLYQDYLNEPLIVVESFKHKYGGKYLFEDEPNQYLVFSQTKQNSKWIYENYLISKQDFLNEFREYKLNELLDETTKSTKL